jgi:hypothetical protein
VRGDVAGAIRKLTRSRELGHESGNVGAEMQALVFEAGLHLASGRHDQARELLESACDLVELQPFYEGNAYCLEAVASHVAGVDTSARPLGCWDSRGRCVTWWGLAFGPCSTPRPRGSTTRSVPRLTGHRSTQRSPRAGRSTRVRVR